MRVLITPTVHESQAVLDALPGVLPAPEWEVPAWRVGDLLIVEPGIGPERTAALLPRLDALEPQVVWLFGWCGGLKPELEVGDLVLSDATISIEMDGTPAMHVPHPVSDSAVRRLAEELDLRMVVGPVLTSDHVLASVEQKRAGASTGAVAVEMEAGPVARWTSARSVPFVHLRTVLDPLFSSLPAARLPADEHGRAPGHALFLHALTHPRDWPALWRLSRQAGIARRTMSSAIVGLTRPGGPLALGT